jgi:nitronate monooxygenase
MMFGAEGMLMGTRFYASQDAEGHPEAKRRIVAAASWLGCEDELDATADEVARDYVAARERGDFDIAGVIAGEACALINDIPPAGKIIKQIVAEAERLLPSRLGGVG